MPDPKSLCGATTKRGGTCRNGVAAPGERCRRHNKRPLNGKLLVKLCYKTVQVVAELGAAYDVFQAAHPHVTSILNGVTGFLMPEHFWDDGFRPRDLIRMEQEEKEAHLKAKVLEARYSSYQDNEKLMVERAYREILACVECVKVGKRSPHGVRL